MESAQLEYGGPPTTTRTVNFGRIVKQSLTKKSRTDLARRMIGMCTLSGWQATTLNPDMSDPDKLAIVTGRFGKIAVSDDPDSLYGELMELSAATLGWAQGIARREAKERKRASRKARRDRKRGKGKDKDKGEDEKG